LDDEFLESISGADTAEAAAAILYDRCDDPATTDQGGCRDAVQQFFESAPIRLVDHGDAGCRADWEAGHVVLAGADCVSTFHLVDADNRPVDSAVLPADGRLPDSAGIEPGAVDPPRQPTSPGGGPTDGEQAAEQFPPRPDANTPDFNKFEGTQNLEAALRGLYMDCDGDPDAGIPPKPDRDKCREQAREFLAAGLQRAVYSTEEPTPERGCAADWDNESDPPRVVLKGTGCGSSFLLKSANGDLLTDEQIRAATGSGDPEKGVLLPSGTEVVQDGFKAVAECAAKEEDSDDVAACRKELDEKLPPRAENQRPPYNVPESVTDEDAESDTANRDATNLDTTNQNANPDTTNPDTTNPDTTDPDTTNPDTTNPDMTNQDTKNQDTTDRNIDD